MHVMSHVSNHLSELLGQILVPGAGECSGGRETDGTDAGEVVVQRCRAVSVGQLDLADGLHSLSTIAAVGDEVVHIIEGELVKKLVPIGIVIVLAIHIG